MTEITDEALDRLLRAADPLPADALPSPTETEAALRQLLAARSQPPPPARAAARGPAPRTIASELGLRFAVMRVRAGAAAQVMAARVRIARWRLFAGASALLGGVAAAVVVLLGSSATQPAFAITQAADGTSTIVAFVPASALTSDRIAAFNRALAGEEARTGRGETQLVPTSSGLEVRCADGQLVRATVTTGTEWRTPATGGTGTVDTASGIAAGRLTALRAARRAARLAGETGLANTAGPASERQPATDITWRCPGASTGNSGATSTGNTGAG